MKRPKVQIHKNILRAFKLRAWSHYPNEYIEAMYGRVTVAGFDIHLFAPVDISFAAVDHLYYDHNPESIDDHEKLTGSQFLGYIHTHIGKRTCEHLSLCDYEDALKNQELITATCLLYKTNGRKYAVTHFEIPKPPVLLAISNK